MRQIDNCVLTTQETSSSEWYEGNLWIVDLESSKVSKQTNAYKHIISSSFYKNNKINKHEVEGKIIA